MYSEKTVKYGRTSIAGSGLVLTTWPYSLKRRLQVIQETAFISIMYRS